MPTARLLPLRGDVMAYRILVDERFVEVVHTGEVRYADRLAALDDLHRNAFVPDGHPVLINFLAAVLILRDDRSEDADEREYVDYMARAITHPFFAGRYVAIVGAAREDVRPATVAAAVRGIACRVFGRRDDAVDWLFDTAPAVLGRT